jgi:hypothetical protein
VEVVRSILFLLGERMSLMVTDVELELVIKAIDLSTIHPLDLRLIHLRILNRILHDCIQVCTQKQSAIVVDLITSKVAANYI